MKIIKEISKEEFVDFIFEKIDTNDKNIYTEMNSDTATGIFQLSADTAKKFSKQIKPENFDELNAVNSLSRPGSSYGLPFYIDGKNNGVKLYPDKVHTLLEETFGVILFQEQVMNIFHKIGGFTLEEANEVRSLMKKLGKLVKDPKDVEKWNKQVERFTASAIQNGLTKQDAERLAEDMVKFSGYSFNKSHATSYTLIAVITLYLSFYFRKYFYSALLSYNMTKDESDILSAVNSPLDE